MPRKRYSKKEYQEYVDITKYRNAEKAKNPIGYLDEPEIILSYKNWKKQQADIDKGMAGFLHPKNWTINNKKSRSFLDEFETWLDSENF